MDNSGLFRLLKDNNLVSYTEHFDKYIAKRVNKAVAFLKVAEPELPDGYDSYEELLYCILNNDTAQNHICRFCHNKEVFVNATRGYHRCGNIKCKVERTKETNFEKYGVSNPAKAESVKEKIRKTNIEKYGCEYGLSNRLVIEKRKKTCIEKYGVDNVWKAGSIKDKIVNTNIEKYGFTSAAKNEDIKNKARETCFEKYGVASPLESQEIIDKAKNTFFEKYGVSSYTKTKEYKERIKVFWENVTDEQLEEWKNKQRQTSMKRFGVEYFTQTHEFHKMHRSEYLYDGLYFDSSWELYFYIYCKDHNFNIIKNPVRFTYSFEDKIHYYMPDFSVDGQMYEIKGDHFFDESGNLVNPFNRSQDARYKAKQKCMDEHGVKVLRWSGMQEIMDYVNNRYTGDFVFLFKTGLPFPYPNKDFRRKNDMGLIQHFHKSIYEANICRHLSPLDAWNNKELVRKTALNRIRYTGRCRPEDIVQGFSVTKAAPKVSVFSSDLAKDLIGKYLSGYSEVFDPFSGFSGRMLGAVAAGKRYIGRDINGKHVSESQEIIQYRNIENLAQVEVQDIMTDSPHEYECLFTCPPYGNKEHWNENDIEKPCDEWIRICLEKYKCSAYLFVVDETQVFGDFVVDTIRHKSHFADVEEKVILIRTPSLLP